MKNPFDVQICNEMNTTKMASYSLYDVQIHASVVIGGKNVKYSKYI